MMVGVSSLRRYLSKDLKKFRELALWISEGRHYQVEKAERTKTTVRVLLMSFGETPGRQR